MHYAVSKKKDFLVIKLGDVNLSPGLEMQLSISQSIDYRRSKSPESLTKYMEKASVLQGCKEQIVKETPSEMSVPGTKPNAADNQMPKTDREDTDEKERKFSLTK